MPSHAPDEFQYLLEAAEQVSRAPTVETGDDAWNEEDTQSPRLARHVRYRRRRGLENTLLTRVYTNRPHIPGEDSGSDTNEDEQPISSRSHAPPEERLLSDSPYVTERSSTHEGLMMNSATQSQRSDPPFQRPTQLRQRLQGYVSNHTRQLEDLGAMYGFDRSDTPIRARRAPPRPQAAQNMEETLSRAAVFERRLERALREYRTARRAWSSNNSHPISAENRIAGNSTSSTGAAQNLIDSTESDTTNLNSIHDFLRSARRDLLSSEGTTNSNDSTRDSGYLSSLRNPSDLSQYYMHRWQRESETRLRHGASGPDSLSAASISAQRSDRHPRYHQTYRSQATGDTSTLGTYSARRYGDDYASSRQLTSMSRREPSFSQLTSGPLFEGLRNSRTSMDNDQSYRGSTHALSSSRPRPEAGSLSLRHLLRSTTQDEITKMQKPKAILKFFAQLREEDLTREEAWKSAAKLGIHDLHLEQMSQSKLATSLSDLPAMQYTSWLEPGVTWHGPQYADVERDKMEPGVIRNQLMVKVVLHSIDWDKMTLTGTMETQQYRQNKEIESFFAGEIIDFRNHGLDTSLDGRAKTASFHSHNNRDFDHDTSDASYQDLEMDLIHWLMLGPFKRDIDRTLSKRQSGSQRYQHRDNLGRDRNGLDDQDMREDRDSDEDLIFKNSPDSKDTSVPYTRLNTNEMTDVRLTEIARLLSDAQWLRDNLNKAGWILMRWKEQCFIPSRSDFNMMRASPPSGSSRTRPASRVWTTVESEREEAAASLGEPNEATRDTWSLSINGFYYVALNRQTGEIEALYHEPGSVLYQRLEMKPSPPASESGLRTNFSLVEYR